MAEPLKIKASNFSFLILNEIRFQLVILKIRKRFKNRIRNNL